MKRAFVIAVLALVALGVRPATAAADLTGFLGVSPTPSTRSAGGFAISVGLTIVGFEFEYARTSEDDRHAAPSLSTGMFNLMVMTPTTGVQVYATVGGGIFHEALVSATTTSVGTNVGAGVKISLTGPIRLRLDYRVFALRGGPLYKTPQRFYAGICVSF
jgi:opacity protein-like surface antigen